MAQSPPPALDSLDLDGIAHYILSDKCNNIVFLTGAGISVSAGIPDFRSPGGMYDTLKPDLLTATKAERQAMRADPTTVVSWSLFQKNQLPYLELRRPFILGLSQQQWKATLAHWFIALCEAKGKLLRLYTQNIDGLDFQTTIPRNKITGVHGSLGIISCEFCKAEMDYPEFQALLKKNIKDIYKIDSEAPEESTPIPCDYCGQPGLKPKTVLYGSSLPPEFFEHVQEDFPDNVDLLIVVGTSLTVGPANTLVAQVSSTCPRFIVNNEKVGQEFGIKYGTSSTRDVFSSIGCDQTFALLANKLGWVPDLFAFEDKLPPESKKALEKYK